jgi:hypothetical protein
MSISKSDPISTRRKKYREFIKGMLRERDALKWEMNKRIVYGSEDFIEKVTKEYKVGAVINQIGRPRKEDNKLN